MQIHPIHKEDFEPWDKFVNAHPKGSVFQSSTMYTLFEGTRNFTPIALRVEKQGKCVGVMLAVIIREYSGLIGLLSSRTVIYGGPLIDESQQDKEVILDTLLKELISQVKNKSVFIQFRNFYDRQKDLSVFEQNGFDFLERLNYLVDTSSGDLVKKRMSSSKMRQVKKGLASGAKIIEPKNLEQVREFYQILHQMYKNKVKKPLPKFSFFKRFYELSATGKLGIIRLIEFEGKIIGGIVSPIFDNQVIYEWYICGLDQEYRKLYPSVLATWAAIDYAVQNDIRSFDFMGVGIPDKDYGVREFKAKFGGEMTNYGRFGRINNQFIYLLTEIGFNILAMLKKI